MNNYSIEDLKHRLKPSATMPVMFVGHGNPMHAISDNEFTRTWAQLGSELPEAQAIVVISAHWQTPGETRITDAPRNRVIYDFTGFPEELFQVPYPSEGDPAVARVLAQQLAAYEAKLDSQWGLDHGTWAVLKHMEPSPQVPILQISIDYSMPLPQLYELFAQLRSLRKLGVQFIGSGNIVHSLPRARWGGGPAWDWAEQFDHDTARAIETRDTATLLNPYESWAEARLAVPTDDHYRPMVAALSLLDSHDDLSFFNEAIDMGSIGMRSFVTV